MNPNARTMLVALLKSPNPQTRESVGFILSGKHPFRTPDSAEELATKGILGGFLKAVMTGSFRDAWCVADELNRSVLAGVIPDETRDPE